MSSPYSELALRSRRELPAFSLSLTAALCGYVIMAHAVRSDRHSVTAHSQAEAQSDRVAVNNRRKGFNCLSPIDGSDSSVVDQTKARLRDPDSFEHIETRITPTDAKGQNRIIMTFRSRNAFGGMVEGRVLATVMNLTCMAKINAIEN